ncbi:uncharacterized protein N7511_008544 [Penicillium nucicola]|uniref:uncharacterized protein n=1 Tax=Penicillium nucicola TaxID=1850975 RepID=UPI00254564FF|nr:uncharacterized protein N7511_008544 [Penicillium nucicola]KAJ5746848.1 hypothetical protein N7511_008544 [Penicillium nucicola]
MSILSTRLKFSTGEAEHEMSSLDRHQSSRSISRTALPRLQSTLDAESLVTVMVRATASSMQHAIGKTALWSETQAIATGV